MKPGIWLKNTGEVIVPEDPRYSGAMERLRRDAVSSLSSEFRTGDASTLFEASEILSELGEASLGRKVYGIAQELSTEPA